MKRLKKIGITLVVLAILVLVAWEFISKPLPHGEQGAEADALAHKMLTAINHAAWDSTAVVSWSFGGSSSNRHVWDKKRHFAKVSWNNHTAWFEIDTQKGRVETDGIEVTDEREKAKLIEKAWHLRNNDAFWLNPVSKVFDDGTERRLIKKKEGNDALLITYSSGGSTPGDSYLWLVDDEGLPYRWDLWVKIIPLGGFSFSWEEWITSETGVKIASLHQSKLLDVKVENVSMAFSLEEIMPEDEFSFLVEN